MHPSSTPASRKSAGFAECLRATITGSALHTPAEEVVNGADPSASLPLRDPRKRVTNFSKSRCCNHVYVATQEPQKSTMVFNASQSSTKKQQSISSFFTKSTPTPKTPTPFGRIVSSGNVRNSQSHNESESPSSPEVEDETRTALRRSSKTRSNATFTAPEGGDVSDDKVDDIRLPARKKLRLSDQNDDVLPKEPSATTCDGPANHLIALSANHVRQPPASKHTSKYTFSSSATEESNEVDDEDTRREKERLHARFVKKLGRPDSIAEIKRRNWQITEETEQRQDENDGEASEEEPAKPPKKTAKAVAGKKGASKLTPMEKQFLEIKKKNLDTILIVEVGYKFKFFGEDARVAAKELSIVCIPGRFRYDEHPSEIHLDRFASASIPVHRLHVHVKRLVGAGHKVGVVRQLETAALKAVGDNRNAPFVRKLTNLYTKGTYIDDIEGLEGNMGAPAGGVPATGYLVCITETNATGWGTDEKVQVGLVAVQPATGDVIYDHFEDGFMRSEVETRLLHIAPCEILISGDLSKATEKLVQHLSASKTNVFGDKVRVERADRSKTAAAEAYSHVSNFYANKIKLASENEESKASKILDNVLKLAEGTTICLSAMITHLSEYGLEHVFDLTKYFQSFSARSHMLLNGTSLTSLEIFQNQTDHTEKGSLFWTLDRTKTRFGQRLLRKWVGRPLLVKSELEERVSAVQEFKEGESAGVAENLRRLLSQVKTDLEKSLIRIYYGKCTRPELLTVLQTLQKIANQFIPVNGSLNTGFQSPLINNAIEALPTIANSVVNFLDRINPEAAKTDDKYAFFRGDVESEEITEHKLGIAAVEHDLDAHRAVAADKLKKKKIDYVTVAGIEYLIEVDNTQLKNVPASWAKISGTKKLSRFHTPEVIRLIRERDQHKESLAAACDVAFSELLVEISAEYQSFRDCVQALATLDCLLSLATVANQPGYVKPEYTDEICLRVSEGRHPMVEQLLLDSYVPNDTNLSTNGTRALLITGPNMGGKSSYVKQTALLAIMGQIGSYIPAASAQLGLLDAVLTRMGAFDNMMAGESTFMVELSETADILKQATARSLVILDELGRGTSTHDGVAIAHAVLGHIVRDTKALALFITHYQSLASLALSFPNGELKNVHMQFHEEIETGDDGSADTGSGGQIAFLYSVGDGVAHRSYGLNVARLAHVPESVLQVAQVKSRALETEGTRRKMGALAGVVKGLLNSDVLQSGGGEKQLELLKEGVETL